jgi:protein-tyrosine phosphatase
MTNRLSFLVAATGLFAFGLMTAHAGGVTLTSNSPAEILANHMSSMHPMSLPGVSIGNFGVVDGRIYRGEQPGGKDYAALASIGVKTIIDLRGDAKGSARRDAETAGLKYINIGIDGHGGPTDAQAIEFLNDVDSADGVVYVHCAGGRHRTGSMIAVYRMTHDGWTLDQAYNEMLAYDFYTDGGHEGFKTYVDNYYLRMTIDPSSVPAAFHPPATATKNAGIASATAVLSESLR